MFNKVFIHDKMQSFLDEAGLFIFYIKNFIENAPSHSVSKINAFLSLTQKFSMTEKWQENDFREKLQ